MTITTETIRPAIEEKCGPTMEKLEDSVRKARKAFTQGQREMEDLVSDTQLRIRRHPAAAVGIAAGAGLMLGCMIGTVLGWTSARR